MSGERFSTVAVPPVVMSEPAPPSSGRRWAPRGARESLQPATPPEPPQPPRRRRNGGGFLGKLSAFFTLLVFVAAAGAIAVIYGQSLLNAPGPLKQDKVVFIPRGNGPSAIAEILEQEGVINQALMFEISHLMAGRPTLKFGEYQFKEAATLKDIREVLMEGKSIQHSVTVPEGLTSEQIVNRLKENEILVGEIRTIPREGVLLPDTYRFERGTSREQIIARMENAQKRALTEIWARRSGDIPVKTPNDLVILASIVEKETGRSDERTRVASVFVNRLNRGMRLESDPTIIYGLVGGKGSLGRGILATEIRQPTPYNTYVINGLPPGPIANPGRASMEATANPSRTRDIFFVADGTGGHAFAETYEQHQRNVARWRQIESGNAPPPAAAPAPAAPAPAAQPRPGQQRSDIVPPAFEVPAQVLNRPQQAAQQQPARRDAPANQLPGSTSAYAIPEVPLDVFAPPPLQQFNPSRVDEAGLAPQPGGVESYPVAPGRRQTMQRNANQAGSAPGPLVQNTFADLPQQSDADVAPQPAPRRGPQRGFDAVEGTSRDPLRNKSFDLNSPKTVPSLR
ncbi:MAG: endolytic transglycosylase MltG [Beijerinckiaceae bacterium]